MSFQDFLKIKQKSGWWFQPIWKILVKLDHFPKMDGENNGKPTIFGNILIQLQASTRLSSSTEISGTSEAVKKTPHIWHRAKWCCYGNPRLLLQHLENTFSYDTQPLEETFAKNMTNSQQAINLVELTQQKISVWEDGDEVSTKTTVSPLKMKHLTTVGGISIRISWAQHMSYISCFQSQEIYITAFSNLQKNTFILFFGGDSARILLKTLRNMKFRLNSSWAMKKHPGCLGYIRDYTTQ